MRVRLGEFARHSFAVWSLDSGVPVGDLQDQLGHASLATTGIYLKASPEPQARGVYEVEIVELSRGGDALNVLALHFGLFR